MKAMISKLKEELKTLRRMAHYRIMSPPKTQAKVVEAFHRLFYAPHVPVNQTWHQTRWMGVKLLKCPLDLWVYQEIIYETRPDLVIETGTADGGSALYIASLFDLLGKGKVVTIDINDRVKRPEHPRITYLSGSSVSEEIQRKVAGIVKGHEKVMVILDSDHRKGHVDEELKRYHHWVSPKHYLIVEDSNVNGHPVDEEHGPGPMEALSEFLKQNRNFKIDHQREKYYLTFNPRGYLLRVA